MILLIGCGASATASTIIAPTDNPAITAQMYRDEAGFFPTVGRVSGSGFSGSGVLIGNQWVLTAGHVATSKTNGTFRLGSQSVTIAQAIVAPGYSLGGPTNDIGLLRLATPISSVEPANMFTFDDPAMLLGREATWVGNGMTGTGLTGYQAVFELRAFTNVIDVYGNDPRYGLPSSSFVADFDRPDGSTNAAGSTAEASRLEGCVAPGDSGGGVFITLGGTRLLVGINSYLARFDASANADYGDLSGASRLDLFAPWIFQQSGIMVIPEPGAAAICLWTMTWSLLRRTRRDAGQSC